MLQAKTDHTPISEPVPILDTFVTELAVAEVLGPCVRLIFVVRQNSLYGEGAERVVVAKLVVPAEVVKHLPIDLATLISAGSENNVVPMVRASLN